MPDRDPPPIPQETVTPALPPTTTVARRRGAPARAEGPRERLQLHGAERLSDAELIAILLGTGGRGEPVEALAARVLRQAGGLSSLQRSSTGDLFGMRGIGPSKASRLSAALELGRRASSRPFSRDRPIRTSQDVDRALRPRLRHETREHFIVVALDARNRPLAELTVGVGGLTACALSPADVFRPVLAYPAHGVILVHNHPSGHPQPSDDDVRVTHRLAQAGALLGVNVLDHVVLGAESSFSFLDAGLLSGDRGKGPVA